MAASPLFGRGVQRKKDKTDNIERKRQKKRKERMVWLSLGDRLVFGAIGGVVVVAKPQPVAFSW